MRSALEPQRWPRQVVNALPHTSWAALQDGPRPWLCLNGACSEALEEDVQAVTKRFDYHWVWRNTVREYGVPGYRHGPLLVPLDEPLYGHAVAHWLRQSAGLILVGPDDGDVLIHHLQRLHVLTASDGLPIGFSLHAARQLEELCEGLPTSRLSELFGPIQRFIWHAGDEQTGEWLFADAPSGDRFRPSTDEPIALTQDDEAALDRASFAWFMRDCAREFRRHFPAYDHPDNEPMLWRHLAHFAGEATDQLALVTERDVRHYMALRFRYPHEYFSQDAALRGALLQRQVNGRQRLFDAEVRLMEREAKT